MFIFDALMKNRVKNAITIAFGLLVAVGILLSNLSVVEKTCVADKKVKSEQSENEASYIYATPATVAPSSTIALESNLLATVLFEISNCEEQEENFISEPLIICERYLATLFRVIISPNAP